METTYTTMDDDDDSVPVAMDMMDWEDDGTRPEFVQDSYCVDPNDE